MKENNRVITILLSAVLTIVVCVAFLYKINSKESNKHSRSMQIEGKAECERIADIADWSMYFEHVGEKRSDLRRKIEIEKNKVISFLVHNGISEKDIEFYNYIKKEYNNRRNHESNTENAHYRMGYCVRIRTNQVDIATKLKNDLFEIFDDDLGIVKNNLKLICSNQNEIEKELYEKAIKDALSKAKDISKSIGIKLGKIIKIDNPRFITESLHPEVDMMGIQRVNSITFDPDGKGSQMMKRQKIKGYINIMVNIK